ncbi:MAG TPA: NAD(P)-binding domain-containing protein [Gaiellaceae bacterium]|jgi:NADPH-dependent F420 reductase|nr:NAD(P)-binding domain-containing protein [Gaiellaceae bacterium]
MRVAIVGGTGAFGRPLTERLAALGHDVVIGSRDAKRAHELATVFGVQGKSNEDAVSGADLVVLAVPSSAAIETVRTLAPILGATPLLCVASDLRFTRKGVEPGRDARSLAEEIAELVEAPVASGLQSLSAGNIAARRPPDEDVFVCGDDDAAKNPALELGSQLVAGRAIDAGPLANSRGLEAMTSVLLNVNRRYKTHAGLRVTGLP